MAGAIPHVLRRVTPHPPLAVDPATRHIILLRTAQQCFPLPELARVLQHYLIVCLKRALPLLQAQLHIRQVQERLRQLQLDRVVHRRPDLTVCLVGVIVQAILQQLRRQLPPFIS